MSEMPEPTFPRPAWPAADRLAARLAEPLPTEESRQRGMTCERCGAAVVNRRLSQLWPNPLRTVLQAAPPVLLCPDCGALRSAPSSLPENRGDDKETAMPVVPPDAPEAAPEPAPGVCDLDDLEAQYALFAEVYGEGDADLSWPPAGIPRWLTWLALLAGCAALAWFGASATGPRGGLAR